MKKRRRFNKTEKFKRNRKRFAKQIRDFDIFINQKFPNDLQRTLYFEFIWLSDDFFASALYEAMENLYKRYGLLFNQSLPKGYFNSFATFQSKSKNKIFRFEEFKLYPPEIIRVEADKLENLLDKKSELTSSTQKKFKI